MNKTVLITGCSSGFGLSMVKILLANDWRVIATARDLSKSEVLSAIEHPMLIKMKLDVTSHDDLQQIKTYITDELNQSLDCLINNAGYGLVGPLEELTEEQIRHQLEVNLMGVILLTKNCLPALRKTKGRIINISSVLGYLGIPLQSLYVTSKFGLEGLTESLYYELAAHGVQITLVEPGLYKTKFGVNVKQPFDKNYNSDYKQQNESFASFRAQLANAKGGGSPDDLARGVLKLLTKTKMPLRKRMGKDAQLVYYLRRLLPAALFNMIMKFAFRRMYKTSYE